MNIGSFRDVPALLRHCVVAVYRKSTSGSPDGVVRAFKICRDKLAQQGYLTPRGGNEILESIMLTGKGYERTLKHMREGRDGDAKDLMFEKLFKSIEPKLWEYDGPGGKSPPRDSTDVNDNADMDKLGVVDDRGVLEDISGAAPSKPRKR